MALRPLLPADDVGADRTPAGLRDLSTSPAALHDLADTLDRQGAYRMAIALRAEAEALAGGGGPVSPPGRGPQPR